MLHTVSQRMMTGYTQSK